MMVREPHERQTLHFVESRQSEYTRPGRIIRHQAKISMMSDPFISLFGFPTVPQSQQIIWFAMFFASSEIVVSTCCDSNGRSGGTARQWD
jgi:hypothetical protein